MRARRRISCQSTSALLLSLVLGVLGCDQKPKTGNEAQGQGAAESTKSAGTKGEAAGAIEAKEAKLQEAGALEGTANVEAGNPALPKSIILLIADGAGIGQYTQLYYSGDGSEKDFPFTKFPHIGLMTTHAADSPVTDSAASATSLASGVKTRIGVIGLDADGKPVPTVVELAEMLKLSTGLVATSTVSHATPAAFVAHVPNRLAELNIARQMIGKGIDVVLGGGLSVFQDYHQLMDAQGIQVVTEWGAELDPTQPVFGLYADLAMTREPNRQPSTTQMAQLALSRLEKNPRGFFLMVEESQVDWAGHEMNAEYLQGEMESLVKLTSYLLEYQAKHPETLFVLVADHETGGAAVVKPLGATKHTRFIHMEHTANFVPIFAVGPGAQAFGGFTDNAAVGRKLMEYVVRAHKRPDSEQSSATPSN